MRRLPVAHAGAVGHSGARGVGATRPTSNPEIERTEEMVVSRSVRTLPGTLRVAIAAAALSAGPAAAQNLEAGKAGAQIFAEVCSGCHRSAHDLRNGASASFLREHYTTGSDMASTMAAYLASAANDPRAAPAAKRAPAVGTAASAPPQQATADPKAAAAQQVASPPNNNNRQQRPGAVRPDAAKPLTTADTKPGSAPPVRVLEEFEE